MAPTFEDPSRPTPDGAPTIRTGGFDDVSTVIAQPSEKRSGLPPWLWTGLVVLIVIGLLVLFTW